MSLLQYKYYDSPEGHDIYKKAFVTSKYAALTGAWIGAYDVLMYSKPKGILKTGTRYMFYIGPLVGMACAFTVTANVVQNNRGKNDHWNYALGGVAAGAVFGAWAKCGLSGVVASAVLAAAASIKKMGVDNGYTFIPEVQQMKNNPFSIRHDLSLCKDLPELRTYVPSTNN